MFTCLLALFTAVLMAGGQAPDIAARVTALGDGTLGFMYTVRDGVTGNGRGVRMRLGPDSSASFFHGRYDGDDDLMEEGSAHVTVRVRRGRAVDLDVVVGGSGRRAQRADLDLGEVAPTAAASWFVGLVENGDEDVVDEALIGAGIARDVDIVEPLLGVARDRNRDSSVRSDVLHWLVILAGERMLADVTAVIDDEDEDVEYREHAVFALAQLGEETALPPLMDIARSHSDPRLRRSALFALTQFEDTSEVVALLEEILTE